MTMIHPWQGLPAAPGPREDLSFDQRQAWRREYERAAQQAQPSAAAPATQAPPADGREGTAEPASAPSLAGPGPAMPVEAAMPWHGPAATMAPTPGGGMAWSAPPVPRAAEGAPRHGPAPAVLGPVASACAGAPPSGLTGPTATGPSSTGPTAAGTPAQGSSAPSPAGHPPPQASQGPALRSMNVAQADGSLAVTLRDSALVPRQGQDILRRLNASGATQGLRRVIVTVNGHSIEQRIHVE